MANAILPGRKKLWQSSMTTRRSAWSVLSGAWKFTQSALHTRSTTGMEVGTRALLMQWMNSLENMGTRSPSTASAKRFGKAQTLQAAWEKLLATPAVDLEKPTVGLEKPTIDLEKSTC